MRTILITGPGGSGRTTVAAATAVTAARAGTRTLVLSADRTDTLGTVLGVATGATPAQVSSADRTDTLGTVLGVATGATPAQVSENLTAWRPDATAGFRDDLTGFQERASNVLDLLGASRLDPEEVTPLPGAEELTLLRALRDAALSERHELLVVDLPPVPQALALLSLPEELRRYLRRLLPTERQAAAGLRPVLGRLAGVPMPSEWLYETAARWDTELGAVEAVLADRGTVVRLVAEPGPAGADAVRSASLALALRGLRPDTLVANRVVPEDWPAGLVAQQRKALEEWQEPYDVRTVPHLGHDPRGTDDLTALAVPGAGAEVSAVAWPVADQLADDGVLVWHLPLPGAIREELDLVRRGDELVVTAGQFRRIVPLPSALRRCTVAGAALREGELRIRFAPDPDLWPRTP
ncbi:ArsA family ATPase [Streptomyces sp. SID13726]|uniref:ArsA family ATPase n=1 Tax=Streptomyces sp. SID13726 TaxID=2706058 RepID=UPI0013B66185|nr:ArsA family ATPase [Streptomyces sp. SID13726]NEB01700.1 ArsA family ATPase [Streptomyces sp. SID13726]